MAKMGRPKIQIDQVQFENLCKMQCTENEVAAWFGCSVDTIERWCKSTYGLRFADIFAQKREAGKISLRRSQWLMAQSVPSMAIFLGKQYLGQTDDPRRYSKEETTEDKIDRLLDTLTTAIATDDGDDDEQ